MGLTLNLQLCGLGDFRVRLSYDVKIRLKLVLSTQCSSPPTGFGVVFVKS
jgi:hypothetical protein